MARILVVDDSRFDQRLIRDILASDDQYTVWCADDGQNALSVMDQGLPDLVLTDLQMPEMDGLTLTDAVRERYPAVPVVLITAHGSEDIAAEALRKGAASYVPKRFLRRDLRSIVGRVLGLVEAHRQEQAAVECLEQTQICFVLQPDRQWVRPVLSYLRREVARFRPQDETAELRVSIALEEALSNAIDHGSLEADPDLRERDFEAYVELLRNRRAVPPYCDRRVYLTACFTRQEARYVVRDEGPGFDPASLPDPTDPANIEMVKGRGLLLMHSFMDEIRYNDVGNEVTMVKRWREGDG